MIDSPSTSRVRDSAIEKIEVKLTHYLEKGNKIYEMIDCFNQPIFQQLLS